MVTRQSKLATIKEKLEWLGVWKDHCLCCDNPWYFNPNTFMDIADGCSEMQLDAMIESLEDEDASTDASDIFQLWEAEGLLKFAPMIVNDSCVSLMYDVDKHIAIVNGDTNIYSDRDCNEFDFGIAPELTVSNDDYQDLIHYSAYEPAVRDITVAKLILTLGFYNATRSLVTDNVTLLNQLLSESLKGDSTYSGTRLALFLDRISVKTGEDLSEEYVKFAKGAKTIQMLDNEKCCTVVAVTDSKVLMLQKVCKNGENVSSDRLIELNLPNWISMQDEAGNYLIDDEPRKTSLLIMILACLQLYNVRWNGSRWHSDVTEDGHLITISDKSGVVVEDYKDFIEAL